jgi:hypothetical protein
MFSSIHEPPTMSLTYAVCLHGVSAGIRCLRETISLEYYNS